MNTVSLRNVSRYTSRGISPKYVESDGLLVLNQKCIRNQKIDLGPARLTDSGKKFNDEKRLRKFDILINSTGVGTLGRIAQLKFDLDATVDSHVTIFRPAEMTPDGKSKLDPLYIGYSIRNQEKFIESLGAGATGQTELSKDSVLDGVVIQLPDFKIQTNIGSVLSAYDDLIENNEKRIKILEEMAERLYREWFVNFKFPGHEKVKLVESGTEYGRIPEGWEVNKIEDISDFKMGQSPESKYYNSDGDGLPFHQGVSDFGDLIPTNRIYATQGNKHAMLGDILFSVRAPVGEINLCTEEIVIGRGVGAFRHKMNHQWFLLCALKNRFTEKDLIGNGAIYKAVNKNEIQSLLFLSSPEKIEAAFNNLAGNFYEEIVNLFHQNAILSQTRDLLIPQLVTGRKELQNL